MLRRCLQSFSIGLTLGLALASAARAAAAEPQVVVSIKPLHSLVAGVMEGVGEPSLLIKGGGSPHTYSLRPSEARLLERADAVFWVGEGLETFLEKPLEALAGKARIVAFDEAPGVNLLEGREGGAWEDHGDSHDAAHDDHEAGHDEHGHEQHGHEQHGHDEHGHDEHGHDEHGHDEAGHDEAAHDHEDHAGHSHGAKNLHIWLDPVNGQAIVQATVSALTDVDPGNAARYRANGERLVAQLKSLDRELEADLAAVKGRPFVVFHDAYQYFEEHYGLNAVGSITVSPERAPGAKRLKEIRKKLNELEAACVFAEPQFQPSLVETVVEGTSAKSGVLDPLGADLETGPEAYFQIMRQLATELRSCLTPAS